MTITGLSEISYEVDERALIPARGADVDTGDEGGRAGSVGRVGRVGKTGRGRARGGRAGDTTDTADPAAYVRVHFDFSMRAVRLRSTYVVVYRYRDALIAQQELYYDPSAQLEILPWT